jgi:hypothetical protein
MCFGCSNSGKLSAKKASEHVGFLAETIKVDVEEVRSGLPQGPEHLVGLFGAEEAGTDAQLALKELEHARRKVQDLRVAKSTFFAVATPQGSVLRSTLEQDLMAGKNVFEAFPALKGAQGYVETLGAMVEARGVEGKPDAQWVAAVPIAVEGENKGLYITGWSFSQYAYRLEFALRGSIRSELDKEQNEPLVYVHLLWKDHVVGAPVSPEVNAEAISKLGLLGQLSGDAPVSAELEITGRAFGVAAKLVPALGEGVAVAVLRSET